MPISKRNIALDQIISILNNNNINYWIDWGTLLGIIRDNKLFDWDHDIDISFYYKDISKVINIFEVLKDFGYTIKVEKDFPFVDCMIQLYLPEDQKDIQSSIDHIDLYF